MIVKTATGGGVAGPLRVDFDSRVASIPYSEEEARAAFARSERHHRENGW